MASSWLADCISRHFPAGAAPDPVPLREALDRLLTDPRGRRGKRHSLSSLVSVLVTGVASAHCGPLAVAQAAAGWDQDVLTGHGCRVSPRTGLRVPPSASMLDRLPKLLDADELEAALSACVASAALDPAVPAAYRAERTAQAGGKPEEKEAEAAGRGEFPRGARRRLVPRAPGPSLAGPGRKRRSRARARPARGRRGRQGTQARQGRREQEGAPARCGHPRPRPGHRPGQGRQGREGERGHPLPAAAGAAAPRRGPGHSGRDADDQGQRALPPEGQERTLPVARPRQPARPERAAQRPALGNSAGTPPPPARSAAAASRPAPSRSSPPPSAPASRTQPRPSSSSATPRTRRKASGTRAARPSSTSPA